VKMLILLIVLSVFSNDITKIAKVNTLKRVAENAYKNGDYETAISSFRLLTDSLGLNEDPIYLNMANAYFHQNDTANAEQYYSKVLSSSDDNLRSRAFQQMGVIHKQKNKMKEAMTDFKAALKSNPDNEEARYNYELLKKILEEQQQQENNDEDIEPSEYAKRLKEQADKLARQFLYGQALSLMQQGLQEDETVAAYNGFISKLNEVVESKE